MGGDHHDGVPIFIYSRHEPRIDSGGWPLVTFVTDVESAMAGTGGVTHLRYRVRRRGAV